MTRLNIGDKVKRVRDDGVVLIGNVTAVHETDIRQYATVKVETADGNPAKDLKIDQRVVQEPAEKFEVLRAAT